MESGANQIRQGLCNGNLQNDAWGGGGSLRVMSSSMNINKLILKGYSLGKGS